VAPHGRVRAHSPDALHFVHHPAPVPAEESPGCSWPAEHPRADLETKMPPRTGIDRGAVHRALAPPRDAVLPRVCCRPGLEWPEILEETEDSQEVVAAGEPLKVRSQARTWLELDAEIQKIDDLLKPPHGHHPGNSRSAPARSRAPALHTPDTWRSPAPRTGAGRAPPRSSPPVAWRGGPSAPRTAPSLRLPAPVRPPTLLHLPLPSYTSPGHTLLSASHGLLVSPGRPGNSGSSRPSRLTLWAACAPVCPSSGDKNGTRRDETGERSGVRSRH
jgi:hypothetical protein